MFEALADCDAETRGKVGKVVDAWAKYSIFSASVLTGLPDILDGGAPPPQAYSPPAPAAQGDSNAAHGAISRSAPANAYAPPGHAPPGNAQPGFAQPGYAQQVQVQALSLQRMSLKRIPLENGFVCSRSPVHSFRGQPLNNNVFVGVNVSTPLRAQRFWAHRWIRCTLQRTQCNESHLCLCRQAHRRTVQPQRPLLCLGGACRYAQSRWQPQATSPAYRPRRTPQPTQAANPSSQPEPGAAARQQHTAQAAAQSNRAAAPLGASPLPQHHTRRVAA